MLYGIIKKDVAEANLIDCYGRMQIEDEIIVNEYDIMRCNVRGATLSERADHLGTRLYTIQEIKDIKNK